YTTNQGGYYGNTYRYYLWHDLNTAGHWVDFVGSFTIPGNGSYADPNFDQDHQARSGAKTAQLRSESENAISAFQPDVAIIQIGVNDIWGAPSPPGDPNNPYPYDPPAAMADISGIIANLRAANPDVIVLLGELLPCFQGVVCTGNQDFPSRIDEMNQALIGLVMAETTPESPVELVPLNSQIYPGDLSDGLHPNDVGDQKVATTFFDALQALL
ncbi:MAG: hypothetical protein KJO36_14030, partial [Acidimicrobiia bacterium]|nr:hypothetical protein [Acidimicrobiia bacterium]